jgi:hypothetical protein
MTTLTIPAADITAETVPAAIAEIERDYSDIAKKIATACGVAIADLIEAIATHVVYTDTDYIYKHF